MGSNNSGRVGARASILPVILYFLFNFLISFLIFLISLLTPGVKTYYSLPTPKKNEDLQTHSTIEWFFMKTTHPEKMLEGSCFSGGGVLPDPRAARNTVIVIIHSFVTISAFIRAREGTGGRRA